jgi:hypothetical protein
MSARDRQVGGDYYKRFKIQPYEFFLANKVPHHKAAIIRRIIRYNSPHRDCVKELNKIIHECEYIKEIESLSICTVLKETVKQMFDKIKVEAFLSQARINVIEKFVIKTIYKYDTLIGYGHSDIDIIRNLACRIKANYIRNHKIHSKL